MSTDSPLEAQRRSLIGFVARKLAEQLGMSKEIHDTVIYLPFAIEHFALDKEDKTNYVLFLSDQMISWIQHQEDVYIKILQLELPAKELDCFLRVYEEVKHHLEDLLHPISIRQERGKSISEDWHIYRDVMYAVSQRKFLLIEQHKVATYKECQMICEAAIKERSDIPKAREIAKAALMQSAALSQSKVMSYLLVISEGITNILKHANEGIMTITRNGRNIYVVVEDDGPGFDLKLLPNTALMAGYSTKKSLGQGFTLMMKMSEQVLLATSPNGSSIILVFQLDEGEEKE